jgi:hypothetical protein
VAFLFIEKFKWAFLFLLISAKMFFYEKKLYIYLCLLILISNNEPKEIFCKLFSADGIFWHDRELIF